MRVQVDLSGDRNRNPLFIETKTCQITCQIYTLVAYHLNGGMQLHDMVRVNCKKCTTAKNQVAGT